MQLDMFRNFFSNYSAICYIKNIYIYISVYIYIYICQYVSIIFRRKQCALYKIGIFLRMCYLMDWLKAHISLKWPICFIMIYTVSKERTKERTTFWFLRSLGMRSLHIGETQKRSLWAVFEHFKMKCNFSTIIEY